VRLAHQFAMESDLVTADMVEASEFPQLAMRHAVMGVPKTIVNDRAAADGMLPEGAFLEVILAAARGSSS
jgi:hypothetical protein